MQYVYLNYHVLACADNCSCEVPRCEGNEGFQTFTSSDYTCLAGNENHTFCNQHNHSIRCPVHARGRRRCEMPDCLNEAKKYSRNHFTCLLVNQYHFFCDIHAGRKGTPCPVHPQHYRR